MMIRMLALAVASLFGSGCARAVAEEAATTPPRGPGYHAVALPTEAGTGPGREVKVLLETPHVKIATITLRGGTVLEEHSAPMPVTIQALRGTGTIRMGDARETLGADKMVTLAPGVPHSVTPEGKSDLLLLVQHLKGGPGSGPGPGPHRETR